MEAAAHKASGWGWNAKGEPERMVRHPEYGSTLASIGEMSDDQLRKLAPSGDDE